MDTGLNMKRVLFAALLLASPALAQQAVPPAEQALNDQLLTEVNIVVQIRKALIETQRKLSEAEAKIKTLEEKK
jgi:hypothetical protein